MGYGTVACPAGPGSHGPRRGAAARRPPLGRPQLPGSNAPAARQQRSSCQAATLQLPGSDAPAPGSDAPAPVSDAPAPGSSLAATWLLPGCYLAAAWLLPGCCLAATRWGHPSARQRCSSARQQRFQRQAATLQRLSATLQWTGVPNQQRWSAQPVALEQPTSAPRTSLTRRSPIEDHQVHPHVCGDM